jgi:hypothetical protein
MRLDSRISRKAATLRDSCAKCAPARMEKPEQTNFTTTIRRNFIGITLLFCQSEVLKIEDSTYLFNALLCTYGFPKILISQYP